MIYFLSILYLATRIYYLLSIESCGNIEILYLGTVAREIGKGVGILPFWDYQFSSYDGGSLVTSLLVIPFTWIFGHSSFSVYGLGILLNFCTFLALYFFLERNFNQRIAVLCSVLLIVTPNVFFKSGTVVAGNHLEAILLKILFLSVFYHLFLEVNNRNNERLTGLPFKTFFLFGFLGGFGTWYCYSFLTVLPACIVLWYILRKTYPLKCYGIFFSGALLGYSPAFFRIHQFGNLISQEIFGQLFTNGWDKFLYKLTGLFYINMPNTSMLFIRLYWIIAVSIVIWLFWNYRKTLMNLCPGLLPWKKIDYHPDLRIVPILIYLITSVLLFGFSNFDIIRGDTNYLHYRYIFEFFPLLSCLFSIAIVQLWDKPQRHMKMIGSAILIFLIVIGITDNKNNLWDRRFPQLHMFSDKGYSYEMLGAVINWRFKEEPRKAVMLLNKLENGYRQEGYRGFGFEGGITGMNGHLHEYQRLIQREEDWHSFRTGLVLGYAHSFYERTELGESYPVYVSDLSAESKIKEFVKTARLIRAFTDEYQNKAYFALGMQYGAVFPQANEVPKELLPYLDKDPQKKFLEGLSLAKTYPDIETRTQP